MPFKTILITGGAGFLGSHVADNLVDAGCRVAIVDDLSSGKEENIPASAVFYRLSIEDEALADVFQKEQPEAVVHLAAQINARTSIDDPRADAKTNILGGLNVLQQCKEHGVKKIVFSSTGGELYGHQAAVPTSETEQTNPPSPYGISKLSFEHFLRLYRDMFGIPYVALRFGNIYGPRQNPKSEAGVISIFLTQMLNGEPVTIHGEGTQTKDYIYVTDAAAAVVKALSPDVEGIYNIATQTEQSVNDIFTALSGITAYAREPEHGPAPLNSVSRVCLSIEKAKNDLQWEPVVSFQKGLEMTALWFKEHHS